MPSHHDYTRNPKAHRFTVKDLWVNNRPYWGVWDLQEQRYLTNEQARWNYKPNEADLSTPFHTTGRLTAQAHARRLNFAIDGNRLNEEKRNLIPTRDEFKAKRTV